MKVGGAPDRLGILGGTFDPIHLGHLDAATAAQRAYALERVLLVPSRTPPHRNIEPRASVFHRFAMAALAGGERGMLVSDLELRRDGPSYTALTLESLHRDGFSPAQLYFITGSDAYAEVATWYDYPRILEYANFVVVSRPGARRPSELIPNAGPSAQAVPSSNPGAGTAVLPLEARTPDASSSEIRRRIAAGEPIDDLVPASVANHIRRHNLYVPAAIAAVL
jgi:nicotinate-nucleotide adenylyltransferase